MIRKFNRYELKYVLRHKEYLRILPFLEKNMKRDKYAGKTGKYYVSSLYFDTPDFVFFQDKIDGFKYRRKLRLRIYPDGNIKTGFVEIKQRINRTVQKRRIIVPFENAQRICRGEYIDQNKLKESELSTAEEILFLVRSLRLKPACIISYQREPLEGTRFDPGVRVTFDTNLKYRGHNLDLTNISGNRYFLPPDVCVMEVKINEKIPIWLCSLISSMQCTLMKVSKYCLGMQKNFEKIEFKRITF